MFKPKARKKRGKGKKSRKGISGGIGKKKKKVLVLREGGGARERGLKRKPLRVLVK